jgi:Uma2 family endonuclease
MSVGHPGYNATSIPQSQTGDPAWEIAFLFPPQGRWTEFDYLALDRGGGKLVELVDGRLEVLPMPTYLHQKLVAYLFSHLNEIVQRHRLGEVVFAPMPVHLRKGSYREPDIVFMRAEQIVGREYPEQVEMVIEVVSEDAESRKRDLVDKRDDYAAAGIPEYWIVDPQEQSVTVLALDGKEYRVHGQFKPSTRATSALLSEFSVDVAELFAAGKSQSQKS